MAQNRRFIKTDKNGTKYWESECSCWKCGGTGTYRWGAVINGVSQFAGVCYACGGSGKEIKIEKEYTPEHEAKLAKARAKRMAKKIEEHEAKLAEQRAINDAIKAKEEARKAEIETERAKARETSQYVGSIGDKITVEVTFVFEASFETQFGTQHIYTFRDDEGNTLVWKTSAFLWYEVGNKETPVCKGDKIRLTASIKDHSEYRGERQTILQRVRKLELVSSKEEKTDKEKAESQLLSLEDGDTVEIMPYRQYRDHYRDCETIAGSYDDENKTIRVIIRAGRLKASGVRGEHFTGYEFKNEKGELVVYRAVSFENALKRVHKEYPDNTWEINHIYFYERRMN